MSGEKTGLLLAGGPVRFEFAAGFVKKYPYSWVVTADSGLSLCMKLGLRPDLAVGDFDTFGRERMEALRKETGWNFEVHRPEKDETDMELAVLGAAAAGCRRLYVLGGTGGRLDHELSNVLLMKKAKKLGVSMELYDEHNRIFLLEAETDSGYRFLKDQAYGTYVSFLPLSQKVEGITLEGFRYPLKKKDISIEENPSLCVSNELLLEWAQIFFERGSLICVESRD